MSQAPELSIILLNYNRVELTRTALANLLEVSAGLSVEVLVVDNGSTDGTGEFLETVSHPDVRIIRNETNLYFGGGNNVGLAEARGKYVLLTQNDFSFARHSLQLMLHCIKALPECGMLGVGGGMVTPHGITELTDWWQNPLRRFHYIPVDFISGCCMMAERSFLNEHNIRFDEGYKLYWEDVDISHQVACAGRKLYMLHNSLTQTSHLRSGSITPLLGVERRERIRKESHDFYVRKWNDTFVPREQEVQYCCFGTKLAFTNEVSALCSLDGEALAPDLQPFAADIEAIRIAEFLEMNGEFSKARLLLEAVWNAGETNFMAFRNLCRIRRTHGNADEIAAVVQELRVQLTRTMPELFKDKLLKHYQIALEQLATIWTERKDYELAIAYWDELQQSARAQTTRDKCLGKKQELNQAIGR